MNKRLFIIVLDGVGVGELPDSAQYDDCGVNTLAHVCIKEKPCLPNLIKLGLGNITGAGLPPVEKPIADWGKCLEMSKGKDTTTGHWEIAGLLMDKPFPTYPQGFPKSIMDEFERCIGVGTLLNAPASGTELLKGYGDEHVKTGKPIVYTSADSVFQIAAHEDIVPIEKLYEMCEIARELLTGEHAVARVIARPFTGESGAYIRTKRRHDFSLAPIGETVLDRLVDSGIEVAGVGKIYDIFAGCGISEPIRVTGNEECTLETIKLAKSAFSGLCFTNLVDTDMLYGHRNDPKGFALALEAFDRSLSELMSALREGDGLIITADHGCDPTTPGTDHTREYAPLLAYWAGDICGRDLGIRRGFYDTAATIAEFFGIAPWERGVSYR